MTSAWARDSVEETQESRRHDTVLLPIRNSVFRNECYSDPGTLHVARSINPSIYR